MILVSVANSMTLLATGTVQLTTINCGNTICEYPHETNSNCPTDCYCGDGYCYSAYENYASCPDDCPAPAEEVPIKKEPGAPVPPVLPTGINETVELEGAPFVHIYAEFKVPIEGARAEVEYVDCEVLEKMLYEYEIPFKCFFTNTENLPDENLLNASIISKVRKDWVEAYNINLSTMKVIRFFRNERTDLPTEPIGPEDERFWIGSYDDKYYYFISQTSGFAGFFLAVGEPMVPLPPVVERPQPYCGDDVCDTTIGEGCATCPRDCGCNPGYGCVSNQCVRECLLFGVTFGKFLEVCWYWWIITAILVLAIIYLLWKKRKRKIPLYLILMILLLILIPVAYIAGGFRRRKSRWQRFLEGVRKMMESLR